MGNVFIKPFVRQNVVRPLKNYNVEERAMKVISKDRPTAAPTYPSMQKLMDDIRKDPELLNKGVDKELSAKLDQVYLTSKGDNPIIQRKKNLPEDRETPEDYEYGYEESAVIPEGKASLKQILTFLSKNQNEPEKYKAEDIAAEYKLDIETVHAILKYFRPFQIYTPEKKKLPSGFMKAIRA